MRVSRVRAPTAGQIRTTAQVRAAARSNTWPPLERTSMAAAPDVAGEREEGEGHSCRGGGGGGGPAPQVESGGGGGGAGWEWGRKRVERVG